MTVPTRGETFAKLIEHVRLAQEDAAMMAHLNRDDFPDSARNWLKLSEMIKKMQFMITELAKEVMH